MPARASSRGAPKASRASSRGPAKAALQAEKPSAPATLEAPEGQVLLEEPAQVPPKLSVPQPSPASILRRECRKKILEQGKEVMVTGMKLGAPAGEMSERANSFDV